MQKTNNGMGEDNTAQNCFTAYLRVAIRNAKTVYLKKKDLVRRYEQASDISDFINHIACEPDMLASLPALEQLENAHLREALGKIGPRDFYILTHKVLNGESLHKIARDIGISFNTASTAYHRILRKLKKQMGGIQGGV